MFEIINETGEVIAELDEPRYVYRSPKNGVWIRCNEPEAECVAINGTRYSIRGKPPIDDAPTVSIKKADAAARIRALTQKNTESLQNIEELKAAYTDLAEAILDLYLNN